MKDIKKHMYIIVDDKDNGQLYTLMQNKKDCIYKFTRGTNLSWPQTKKFGWRCEKIVITATALSNEKAWN